MIGNDVIDLQQSRQESNWQRRGFIEKLFTANEQLLIANDPDPETLVWTLWSMKEAAYKVYNRQTKIREYIPQKLVCTIISKNDYYSTGQVICNGNSFYTKTILSKEKIHTIAVSHIGDLDRVIEIENKGILKDKNGLPYLSNVVSDTFQAVSKSHHGRFEKVVTLNK